MPAVKNVGEPCAGEPHARFEVAAGGTWHSVGNAARALAPPADPTICRLGLLLMPRDIERGVPRAKTSSDHLRLGGDAIQRTGSSTYVSFDVAPARVLVAGRPVADGEPAAHDGLDHVVASRSRWCGRRPRSRRGRADELRRCTYRMEPRSVPSAERVVMWPVRMGATTFVVLGDRRNASMR
ncbi:MAG: hypothetical protein QOK16_1828 [Solirubrobacteraceae bacterium]|nr:hypothetical protein [Solirubrobacteraceae bacterium]